MTTTSRCEIENNSATLGGGVYTSYGTANLRHSLSRTNTALSTGGGMYVAGSNGEVIGNTLDGNSGIVAGLYLVNGTIDVFNNIVASSTGHGIGCSGGGVNLSYNLVYGSSGNDYDGCAAGMGSVGGDPLFADAPGADYHLTINSPAIDAGNPAPAWNDPDGGRGDMGWYGSHTFAMEHPTYPTGLGSTNPGGDLVLTWNRNPEGSVAYYAVYCDTMSGFVPGAGTLVTTTADTTVNLGPAPADTTWYVVCAVDTNGYASGYSDEKTSVPTASSIGPVARLRDSLDQNSPNPFNPSTTIRFTTAAPGPVTLAIYDVSGRRIRTLVNESRPANQHTVSWNGTNDAGSQVASGVYFYRLETSRFAQTRKMVLLK